MFNLTSTIRNNKRLLELKNCHRNRRAFIVGNGPSLKIEDLTRLKSEITFASNRIFLAFDRIDWRPTYYNVSDLLVARLNKRPIQECPANKVFSSSVRQELKEVSGAVFFNPPQPRIDVSIIEKNNGVQYASGSSKVPFYLKSKLFKPLGKVLGADHSYIDAVLAEYQDTNYPWDWNPILGARAGHSVINLSLKLAYWMGIREIYVTGCDHNFSVPDTHTGEVIFGNTVILSDGEQNHFHPDYRKKGDKWTTPQLGHIERNFAYAGKVFAADGGKIVNASRFSKLNVWERVDFNQLFPQRSV